MKKIFIVFIISVIIATVLIIPCSASMTDSFGSYINLFDPSDVVQARFYTDLDNYQDNNFYSVDLVAGQPYTFISSKGSKSFYVGDDILYNNYSSVFSFPSSNLLVNQPFESRGGSYTNYTFSQSSITPTSSFKIQAFNGTNYVKTLYEFNVSSLGVSTITFTKDSSFRSLFIGFNGSYTDIGLFFDVSNLSNGTEYYLILNFLNLNLNSKQWDQIIISKDSDTSWMPGYSKPFYNDNLTYYYTFTPSSSGTWLVGINDVLSGSTSNKFSYNQSSENEFYLVEGSLTPDQVADVLQQDRYNQGYTQGYKEGEYDGMNSTSILKSTILTVLSGPFVVVSNALNFEIFGINIYTFIQIILTILIVAFLITRLKGRE